ncbi:alpha/beta fold hydrolase [Brevibacillus reuszeri]|uniref:alpha/beta fold hydrolase n=1 Tax=Brevibacillus reuszeri TaxID=54915 RepID=UPI002898A2E3|nr:alpha/beta hydrolase [Brevibacillus reuszeri]
MERTILWLPGWGMSNDCWDNVRANFPDCRFIMPDYSTVNRPDHFYQVIEKAVIGVDARSMLVVGWSLGGMLALRLAASYPVAGLVLIGSTARFVRTRAERDRGWSEIVLQRMKQLLPMEREKVMTNFAERMLSEKERELSVALSTCTLDRSEWSITALVAGLSYLAEEDCCPLLSSIICPTLVIHGTEDVICPIPAGEELSALIPGASLFPMVGSGHALPVTCPDAVSEAIKGWWG